jgi:RNA recognition motif-containing protein
VSCYADDAASIYVRNLPFHATEVDLEAFFCQAGPVADIRRGANAEGETQSSFWCRQVLLTVSCQCSVTLSAVWTSSSAACLGLTVCSCDLR